jgi:hypothetical protein
MTDLNRVKLAPTTGGSGRPLTVAALIVAIIAIGLLKPWGGGPQPATSTGLAAQLPSSPARSPALVATSSPVASGDPGGPCSWGMAWRLFTAETSDVGPVRTWYGLQPLPASGPADPRIEVVRIHSSAIGALGYCSISRPGPIHILGTEAWRLVPGSPPRPMALTPAIGAGPLAPDTGVIYGPPSAPAWPAATYVFGIHLATTPWSEEWFAVQIL